MASAELKHLADRVATLEEEVRGEQTVTRQILQLTKDNQAAIADLRTEIAVLRTHIGELEVRVERLQAAMVQLRADLPDIVAQAVGRALRDK